MPSHDDEVRLRHMLDYSREAILLAGERSRRDLNANRMLQLSLVRLVEIVGSGPQLEHDRHRCQPHVARLV